MHVRILSHFCDVWRFATLWTVAHQAPLSTGFSRQRYWSGLPCPPPGDLPDPGIESESLKSSALVDKFFTTSATWKALCRCKKHLTKHNILLWLNNKKKISQQIKYWRNVPHITKAMYDKLIANITINGEELKVLLLISATRQGCPLPSLQFKYSTGGSAHSN